VNSQENNQGDDVNMPLRAETVFILSSLNKSTLAEFPAELDPCVDEALGYPEIIKRMSTITGQINTAEALRKLTVQVREQVAEQILAVTVPAAVLISDPTPIPGIVTPKTETGLPPVPVPLPGIVIPEVKVPGAYTIEFQELIPGLKPPALPMLIPGLENLPLLPGWTVRDSKGAAVKEGVRIPTLIKGLPGIPIPGPLPKFPQVDPIPGPMLGLNDYYSQLNQSPPYHTSVYAQPNYTGADILEAMILEETEGGVEPLLSPYELGDEMLEMDMVDDSESVLVPGGVLGDEGLEL